MEGRNGFAFRSLGEQSQLKLFDSITVIMTE
jgi:hypothetical protein